MIFKPTYGKLGHPWAFANTIVAACRFNYGHGGALFRVRRSSDNAEMDFYTTEGLSSWVGAGNDGFITKMYDQSGKGNDVSNSTAGEQPRIVVNGALVTDSSVVFSSSQLFGGSSLLLGDNCSIEAFVYPTDFGIGNYIFFSRRSSTSSFMSLLFASGTLRAYYANNANSVNTTSLSKSGLATSTWHHIVMTRSGGNVIKLYVNGVLEGTVTDGGQSSDDFPVIIGNSGASAFFTGNIKRVNIYDYALPPHIIEKLATL